MTCQGIEPQLSAYGDDRVRQQKYGENGVHLKERPVVTQHISQCI
jgi:hypothetical protein